MKSILTKPLKLSAYALQDGLLWEIYNVALPYNFIRRLRDNLQTSLRVSQLGSLWEAVRHDFVPDMTKKAAPSRR